MKDVISLIMSFISLVISVWAFINSRKADFKASKVEASNRLSQVHDKTRSGRQVMNDIFMFWSKTEGRPKTPASLCSVENDQAKNDFLDFYNKNYHSQPNGTEGRKLSDEIHTYLHELHHLWRRCLNKEFMEEQVMETFSSAINMDSELITLYLEAHWKEHGELNKDLNSRFWKYVPAIVDKAKSREQNWLKKIS
jgi:hypothetical protein